MRIAQIAPAVSSSGAPSVTTRMIADLIAELRARGHEVTLFGGASEGDVDAHVRAVRGDEQWMDRSARVLLDRVFARSCQFDIIHDHTGTIDVPMTRWLDVPCLTTMHGTSASSDRPRRRDMPVVALSEHQRAATPRLNWLATIQPAVREAPAYNAESGNYLLFAGGWARSGRLDRAIEISRRSGIPLRVLDEATPDTRTDVDVAQLKGAGVELAQAESTEARFDLLRHAAMLISPAEVPPLFDLLTLESLAAGTPILGWRRGFIPEVVVEGTTGFCVDTLDEAVAAVARRDTIDRSACRAVFEEKYSGARLADDYLGVYQHLLFQGRAMSSLAASA